MIIDRIEHARQYTGLGPGIARALGYLANTDLDALPPGRVDLDGDRVFVLVSEYTTKPVEQGRWEAHRRYLDLQSLARGTEQIGWAPIEDLHEESREEARDMTRLAGSGQFLTLGPGEFMLLWPADAHMPGVAVDEPAAVKKIVVKIAVGD
jgi:YhcH/YjgK/YiaL family protein